MVKVEEDEESLTKSFPKIAVKACTSSSCSDRLLSDITCSIDYVPNYENFVL